MNRVKVVKESKYGTISTGYYNENNNFIHHSFDDEPASIFPNGRKAWYRDGLRHRDIVVDENNQPNYLPAIIYPSGNKTWYDHGVSYWVIENQRYNTYGEIRKKYRDKIVKFKFLTVTDLLSIYVDYIYLRNDEYLIFDDTQRNEAILKFG